MRRVFASFLIGLFVGNAEANPLAIVLSNSGSAQEIADPEATNARENVGEPTTEGELDAADLTKLGARLASIALVYESFLDASHLDADAKLLVGYTSPQGLIPNPADRAQTLDRVYRALALIDDTQALRYPEGEDCARAHRRALFRSSDGLFADPKTGELAPWLKVELKRSKAGEAPGSLIAASARERTALDYLQSLAEVRALSLRLDDRNILGAPRAAAFCRRAKVYEELSAAQMALKWNDPDLTAQTKAVVEVRCGKEKSAGTAILVDGKTVVLVSGRFTENAYEAPDLFAKSGKRISASYLRRGAELSVLSIQSSPEVEPLAFPENPDQGERVAYAVGHPIQGGPWSVTRGLARTDGALIRTDAAIDGGQAGGPLFDARGNLTGVVAGHGAAYDLAAIKSWIADENAALPPVSMDSGTGTGALLTASSTFAQKEKGGPIEAAYVLNIPYGVCKDPRGCDLPSAPAGGASNFSEPYNGPNLWSMLGKLLKPAPKKEQRLADNRRSVAPAAPRYIAPEPPKPPPDPLKPNSLKLHVSQTILAQGEEFEIVATVTFTGKEGSVAGHGVSFTGVPGGKISCPAAKTDVSGVARTTCTALEDGRDTTFDSLQDETRRRLGMKTPGRVRRKVAKADKIAEMKERLEDQSRQLDDEADKHSGGVSDTPGIDRAFPENEISELEIKGDRVTLGASLDRLRDETTISILSRPCPTNEAPVLVNEGGSNRSGRFRCALARPGSRERDFKHGQVVTETCTYSHVDSDGTCHYMCESGVETTAGSTTQNPDGSFNCAPTTERLIPGEP